MISTICKESINNFLCDSLKNRLVFNNALKVLALDAIRHIRYIRILTQKNTFQFSGTLELNDVLSISAQSKNLLNCNVLKFRSSTLKTIKICNKYCKHQDYFLFDIDANHYNLLTNKDVIKLNNRLQMSAHYLSLTTNFCKQLYDAHMLFDRCDFDLQDDAIFNKLKKELNISKLDAQNLRMLSLNGSSKNIGNTLNKSPRTIEKIISDMNKKYKHQSKQALQAYARIVATHFSDFYEEPIFAERI